MAKIILFRMKGFNSIYRIHGFKLYSVAIFTKNDDTYHCQFNIKNHW